MLAADSLQCYRCNEKPVKECNSEQKIVNCSSDNMICQLVNYETDKGEKLQDRSCSSKTECEDEKKMCDSGKEIQRKDDTITKCAVACCVTAKGAETPCNGAFAVAGNIIIIVLEALYIWSSY